MKHLAGKLSFWAALFYLTLFYLTLLGLTLFGLTACGKMAVSPGSDAAESGGTGLIGKWNLVTDSTFVGIAQSNHPVDYTGVAGDYFTFDTTGHVYTREGSSLNTLTYQPISDTSVIISDFGIILNGIPDTSTIMGLPTDTRLNLTAQTIIIESPRFLGPGGEAWRKVTLSR